ncbi:hypothetical protein HDU76_001736, partial [Blyttiomyces sp. JEL0837]
MANLTSTSDGQTLSGSIPSEIGQLTELVGLYLRYNSFNGQVPDLSPLTKLQYLYVKEEFTSIPANIGTFQQLDFLDVGGNKFNEVFPDWILGLNTLTVLGLYYSGYYGNVPDFSSLPNLKQLLFTGFTGSLPESIGKLRSLTILHAEYNDFTGTLIPSSIGSLANLNELHLHGNQFSGTIPPSLGNLVSLTVLDLSNNQLTGGIPEGLGNDVGLTKILLQDNLLTGDGPDSLGKLTQLKTFNVSTNCLSGVFPSSLRGIMNGATAQGGDKCAGASASKVPIYPIIGGVVGVLLIAVLAVVGYLYYAKKKKNDTQKPVAEGKNVEEGRTIAGKVDEPFLISKGKIDNNMNPPAFDAVPESTSTPTPVYIPYAPAVNSAMSPMTYNNAPIVYNNAPVYNNTPAVAYNNPPNPFNNPTSPSYSTNPQPNLDEKRSSLFQSQPSAVQSTSTLSATQYPVDQKRQSVLDRIDENSGSSGHQIEAVLVSQWGPYVRWSNEQVLTWAKELSFGEEFVECLK